MRKGKRERAEAIQAREATRGYELRHDRAMTGASVKAPIASSLVFKPENRFHRENFTVVVIKPKPAPELKPHARFSQPARVDETPQVRAGFHKLPAWLLAQDILRINLRKMIATKCQSDEFQMGYR